jgi:carbamate kinase
VSLGGAELTVALGGNAILQKGDRGTAEEQFGRVREAASQLARIVKEGGRVVVTHGNGPQVGDILVQNEAAKGLVPRMPLDVCGAESQGMIGYMLQQALGTELGRLGARLPVATVLTQVVVDAKDPAFRHPTKPVGPFYTREESAALKGRGWQVIEDAGRGYRRVVPSPFPQEIVEKETIIGLFRSGALVIAAGGGGVPVVREPDGALRGVEAVLDKDRTAALLGATVQTGWLLILTDVDRVYLDYNGPRRRPLDRLDVGTCESYLRAGEFPEGSMGPKVESAVSFLKSGGERVVIASLGEALDALSGKSGTTITS